MTTRFEYGKADWPGDVAIAPERVISGSPVASTLTTAKTPAGETGLWRCTPGEFVTLTRASSSSSISWKARATSFTTTVTFYR